VREVNGLASLCLFIPGIRWLRLARVARFGLWVLDAVGFRASRPKEKQCEMRMTQALDLCAVALLRYFCDGLLL